MLAQNVGHALRGRWMDTVEELDPRLWSSFVMEAAKGCCANCGSAHKVSPRLIVPKDAGGKLTHANSVALCRACELASGVRPQDQGVTERRPVNIWVSDRLYKTLQAKRDAGHTTSMGALVRYLMTKYVQEQTRFDDIGQYQDAGTDVRLNVWVDNELYTDFKACVDSAGLTVTAALKALFCMYETEATPLVEAARRN